MISRAVYKQQPARRPITALAVVLLITGLLGASTAVLAVHDEDFQLDGNVADDADATQPFDWASFISAAGTLSPTLPSATRPGFEHSSFDRDFLTNTNGSFNTSDGSTFATGSKDTLPITPGWQCNFDNNVNSKTDVMNAYAVTYTDPVTEEEILYFGLERNANTGDGNVGFWFLQDEVACESSGTTTAFSGDHSDGDLLIVSEFSNGGTVATIQVYEWEGGANGFLNPDAVASGASCVTAAGGDSVCAIVNTGTISTPWLTANKNDGVGNSLRTAEFFEAGLNLTDTGLGGKCFNTFLADTRSSTSLTATIFDFSLGTLGSCTSTTVTTPKLGDGTTNVPNPQLIPVSGQLAVTDSALVTVEGTDTFSGTVTFYLCRDSETTDHDSNAATPKVCSTGGTQIGDAKPVTTSPATVVSDAAGLTAADRYCWRAVFSGDSTAGVPASSDFSASECFTISPRTPTLTTQATSGPVDFGQSISDKIFLSGTAQTPGTNGIGPGGTINATNRSAANGSIKLTAYGPDSCSTVALTEKTFTVSGDRVSPSFYGGPGTDAEFTPTAPGEYVFVASYTGDSPNTNAVAAIACASQPSNERVIVRTIPTSISTTPSAYPQDSATIATTISGDSLPNTGTVIFRLYDNSTCTDNNDVVDGPGLLYKETKNNVGENDASFTVSTNNQTVSVNSNQTVYWKVTYAPGDTVHTGRQSACVENTSFTFTGDAGPGTLFP